MTLHRVNDIFLSTHQNRNNPGESPRRAPINSTLISGLLIKHFNSSSSLCLECRYRSGSGAGVADYRSHSSFILAHLRINWLPPGA